jgi:phage-related baseplate assembly protein
VVDALAVNGQERGDIEIYVLSDEGEPSQELLATVKEKCNRDDVRLIGDYVNAIPAVRREYAIRAEITVYDTHDPEIVLDKVSILAAEYARAHKSRLGADVTPTQVLLALSPVGEGLYHVNLLEPSEILDIGPNEWAQATQIEITLAGVANG